jgi:hypothetical protein
MATASTAANQLRFNSSSFAGPKNVYLYQSDNYGLISGWAQGATWTIPGTVQTPVPVSVTPASSSTASTTFSFAYSDPLGYADITFLYGVINSTLSYAGGCGFLYSRLHNWIELHDNLGNWQNPVPLGTNATISNSYCTINAMQSAGTGSGNNFTLNVAITGTAAFSGAKTIWAMAQGVNGTSSWQTVGTIAGSTQAITIFNTGMNTGGGLIADGGVDSHYTLAGSADSGAPGPNAYAVNSNVFPIPPWISNGPNSKWIAPMTSQGTGNQPGSYTYRTTFNPATAVLHGQAAADNSVVVKPNGTPVTGKS